VADDWHELMIS